MSLAREITDRYYATTAARSHQRSHEYYRDAAAGLLRRFGKWLPEDRATPSLDIACGCGEFLYMLSSRGFTDMTGVDLCREELDAARPFMTAKLVESDAIEFLKKSQDASYGFISAVNFLEHLPKDAVIEVLREAHRVLRPGGTLVAMVPNALSPFGSTTRYWDFTHEWAFTPNNFHQLGALTGFERIDFRECAPVPHGLKSTVRFVAWQAIRAAIAAWLLVEVANTRGGVYTMDMLVRLHRD